MSTQPFILEKPVWTEADFELMGWHDAQIYGMAFPPENREFWIDLDYIFNWVNPQDGEEFFKFWVAPVTLVFSNVYDLKFGLEPQAGEITLQNIERSDQRRPQNSAFLAKEIEWLWRFDCNEGEATFRSNGFIQFTRRPPVLCQRQQLSFAERGGISFSRDYVI